MARIALVERRPDIGALGRAVLLGRGHAVESFLALDDAIQSLRERPPDAVIAGASAPPVARAAETVRVVRNLGPRVLALLLVNGRGDERALLEGLDAGADEVILVPFRPADLAGRVTAALTRAQARGEGLQRSPSPSSGPVPKGKLPRIADPDAITRREGLPVPRSSIFETTEDDDTPDVLTPDILRGHATRLSAAQASAYALEGEERKLAGAAFDDYRLIRTIGVGGMGVVIEAVHSRTRRPVALKILREDVARDNDAALRFLREAYVLQAIDDRNVIRIEDIGRSDGRLFYAMELVKGENLAQKLDRSGKLVTSEAMRIGVGIARALAALARRGIVHRDVKPGNVFLGEGDTVKLGDFGLAKRAFARCVTPVREPLGTPHYLAPEVIEGATATPISDIYSLGVVLHEMLSGTTPYDGRDTMQLLYRVCHGVQADLAQTLADVPDDVRMVVAKALARDPRVRFPDAASLAKCLERCRLRLIGPLK